MLFLSTTNKEMIQKRRQKKNGSMGYAMTVHSIQSVQSEIKIYCMIGGIEMLFVLSGGNA